MIDPYETERKLLAISSPLGAPQSETMRRIEQLAQLLARECPLRELLGSVQQIEAEGEK